MNEVQLVITMEMETRRVQVAGPVHDKMLCYGLLELARDAIKDHGDKKVGSGLLIAQVAVLNGFPGR